MSKKNAVLASLILGCFIGSSCMKDKPEQVSNLTRNDIEAIAIAEVVDRTGTQNTSLDATIVEADDVLWRVTVVALPPTPGLFWVVTIDKSGTVLGFQGGE